MVGRNDESARPKQSAAVLKALQGTDERRDASMQLWLRMCEADHGAIFPIDLVANGAVKRSVSQSSALRLLVESWNLLCARALVRMQIDTALRFSALWLVEKPDELARQILKRQRIDKIRDRDGKLMRDAYLVEKLAPAHPWLPAVYQNLSGYIHFSGAHLFSPMENVQEETGQVEIAISEADTKFPESSWLEVVECFNESTDIFLKKLMGWIKTKEAGAGAGE